MSGDSPKALFSCVQVAKGWRCRVKMAEMGARFVGLYGARSFSQ